MDTLDSGDASAVTVALMRMTALLGPRNGHTAIHPLGRHRTTLMAYPLWIYEFEDGVFVLDADRPDLVGAELLAVEGTGVDEVLRAVTPLVAYDNEWTIRARRPTFVIHASVLHGLGLAENPARASFLFGAKDGTTIDVTLEANPAEEVLSRLGGRCVTDRSQPHYWRRRGEWHWVETVADGRVVHVGYNVTRGEISEFARQIEVLAGSPGVGTVVLDLRRNTGGNNSTYGPLLKSLERLGEEKGLAVLTSRMTFSAAMQLVVDIEKRTPAVFVGEPTGGSPNSYGDAITVELPQSGLNASVATIAWMTAGEGDERLTRAPDVPVAESSAAFFAGADPTLDAAVSALS